MMLCLAWGEPLKSDLSTDFIKQYLSDRGWSATSFNNYMASPWEFIYKNVLRYPAVKTQELQFGTAIHAVLDRLVKTYYQSGKLASDSEVFGWLSQNLDKISATKEEMVRLLERGQLALVSYRSRLTESLMGVEKAKTEFNVKAILKTGLEDIPEVTLTGNFDRVDFGPDGELVRVVDYKTGKPKTRGEIEGTTKTSKGNYKRQLVFYALLLSLQEDTSIVTNNMQLSFVEPDAKGKTKDEDFTITEDEIEELKQQIIKATRMLISGEALEIPCDPEVTEFCPLVERWGK
jgi:RecB family exonuclease